MMCRSRFLLSIEKVSLLAHSTKSFLIQLNTESLLIAYFMGLDAGVIGLGREDRTQVLRLT